MITLTKSARKKLESHLELSENKGKVIKVSFQGFG